jgi:hypothetical protein
MEIEFEADLVGFGVTEWNGQQVQSVIRNE